MATTKQPQPKTTTGYRGKQAKTGNSLGLRFDKALFQSHPEFSGEVRAHVIAPGRMLVVAEPTAKQHRRENDPVMEAFLGFLSSDMENAPQQIKPLDRALIERVRTLVGRVPINPHEELGDEPLI
jgi:hypothetical protein